MRSLISGLFHVIVDHVMRNMMGTIIIFQVERPVFLREQANKMYSVTAYYLAKVLADLPLQLITPIVFTVIVYFGIGMTIEASKFFYFYLILMLLTQCAASFGYFMSSIFNREETAVSLAPIIMQPIILFGG
jgi:ABC-type multidrug transport system permease subunit